MSLTGTVNVANARVDLFVDFTTEAGTQTFATLERRVGSLDAAGEYVRGLFGSALLGEQAYVSDHEAPLDRQIWYVATGGGTATAVMTAGPFTIPSNGYVWIKDPGRPWADLRLDLCETPDEGRDPCPAAPLVSDTFTRLTVAGWGTADTGQTWTNSGGAAADYGVNGSQGGHFLNSTGISRRTTVPQPQTDADLRADIGVSALALTQSIQGGLIFRHVSNSNTYYARLEFLTTGMVRLTLRKRVADVETELSGVDTLLIYTPGAMFTLRVQVQGQVLRARVWPAGTAEPDQWQLTSADASFAAAALAGARSLSATGNTNAAPTVLYDNFQIYELVTSVPDELAWVGFRDKVRQVDAGLFPILGKERPADVYARRKDLNTGMSFLSRSRQSIDRVYDLFTVGGPVVVQVPAVYHMHNQYGLTTDRYFQPDDLTEAYISNDQRRPIRLWSAALVQVDFPVGLPQGTDTANWCALAENYGTYADLTASGWTWAQVATGEASGTLLPTGGYGSGPYGSGIYGG